MNITTVSWILTGLGVAGALLNVRRLRACFVVWIVTNIGWMILHAVRGNWADVVMFAVYFAAAVWGFYSWGGRRRITGALEIPTEPRVRI
ncbi:MAG: nicotinamide mononucleotide transporter family protein [Desulfobulbaceae bacterium]|nr:nicotinamide mononucleotide transporter family protein [Desulfobulbaceae bacterium]